MRAAGTSPLWTDERGEMALVMFGITVVLLGVAGVLLHLLGVPPAPDPVAAGREAAVAAAVDIRDQAVRAGVGPDDLASTAAVDTAGACRRVGRSVGPAAELVSCDVSAGALTLVTARSAAGSATAGQAFDSAVVRFVRTTPGCLALRTSWGDRVAAVCEEERG